MPTNIKKINPIDTEPDVAVGIKLPLTSLNGRLFDLSYTTHEQAISDLKNLLLTNLGERLYHPLFGTNIPKYLFEPLTDSLYDRIESTIRSAVEYWLPYIIIEDLNIDEYISNSGLQQGVYVYMLIKTSENSPLTPVEILYSTAAE